MWVKKCSLAYISCMTDTHFHIFCIWNFPYRFFETKFGASFSSQVIWLHVQQLLDDLFEKPELGDSWLPLASSIIGELLIPCAVWRASKVCHQHLWMYHKYFFDMHISKYCTPTWSYCKGWSFCNYHQVYNCQKLLIIFCGHLSVPRGGHQSNLQTGDHTIGFLPFYVSMFACFVQRKGKIILYT